MAIAKVTRVKGRVKMLPKDLRWSHFHALAEAFDAGMTLEGALGAAGISHAVYAATRHKKGSLDVGWLLARFDPDGVPLDRARMDRLLKGPTIMEGHL